MTYIDFTTSPAVYAYVHKMLDDDYSTVEINGAISRVKIPYVSEIDTDYVLDIVRDEIPLLEDAD